MRLNLAKYKDLSFVVGNEDIISQMLTTAPMQPFSDEVISFLNDLSKKVMRPGQEYSDVATFGFWCRRSALLQEKNKYDDISERIGRGIVFHSTPSNVPVNFAFSFATGLLAGNTNIIRLPAKDFPQVKIIYEAVNELLENTHKNLFPYICMVKYPPNVEITDIFSSICDCRVVWGGDATIAEVRKSPLKARANEITFADRHSIAVIEADEYLNAGNKDKVAQDFFNDTYFSDQNACTAPQIIIWTGNKKKEAKKEFWYHVHLLAKNKYMLTPIQSVSKLNAFYKVASQRDVILQESEDQFITRIAVERLDEDLMSFKHHSGFFFEYDAPTLDDILPLCAERCQTLTYYGLNKEEVERLIFNFRPRGIDRIVPMGKAMDFNLVWDGYDLIRSLSRKVLII